MNKISESRIINLIRFGPIVFVLSISLLFSYLTIDEKKNNLEKEIKELRNSYIEDNKKRINSLVEEIHNRIIVEKEEEYNRVKELIKTEVYHGYSVIKSIYEKNKKSSSFSKEKTIEEIKNALRNIRYLDDLGYMFIYDLNGENILHPILNDLEGKNLWNYSDMSGNSLLQDMNDILSKKNESYYSWFWKKPNIGNNIEYKKIGFFKKFEPLNIFIGSGQYVDEIEEVLKDKIAKRLNRIKFDNFEHIYVYRLDGLCLVNPKKELIGENRYNIKNKKGEYTLRNTLEFAKEKKEGFISYDSNEKISYVKLYEDWNWMIESGFYLESLNNKILEKEQNLISSTNSSIKQTLIIIVFAISFFIAISFYLSNQLKLMFEEYKEKLESEVKDRYEKEKLLIQQSKMATMGEMLGSIAHQWKQPLSLLSLSNGLIRISRESKDIFSEKEVDESIDNIDTAIKNLNQTVEDFRNFFNPNKERTLFKISDAFSETFKLTSSQFKNNNIELINNIENVELYGSQNELQQVLINLLKNAKEELVKKDPHDKRYIFIDTKKDDNTLNITIKDNAGGIPLNIIDKIFEAYFTTKEKNGGSGIGLYISKQIIESHMKGKITVSNTVYKYKTNEYTGAEFLISLPIDLRHDKRKKL